MKRKKKIETDNPRPRFRGQEPSYFMVTMFVAIIFAAGFFVKIVFFPKPVPANDTVIVQTPSPLETPSRLQGSIDGKVTGGAEF